jgi:hypothetical protein
LLKLHGLQGQVVNGAKRRGDLEAADLEDLATAAEKDLRR